MQCSFDPVWRYAPFLSLLHAVCIAVLHSKPFGLQFDL